MLAGLAMAASAVAYTAMPKAEETGKQEPSYKVQKVARIQRINAPQREEGEGTTAYTVPFHFTPTQDQFNECLVIDANSDGKTWTYDSDGYFKSLYSYNYAADDWCMLPAIHLTPGPYKFYATFKTKTDAENFKICLGTAQTAEAMTKTLVQHEGYCNQTDVTESIEITIDTEGDYYIGLYAYSAANKYYVWVKDVKLEAIDKTLPMTPEIKSIDFTGQTGTVTIKTPAQNYQGDEITGNVSLDVKVDGTAVEGSPFICTPGEEKAVPMTLERGFHTVTAQATINANGVDKVSGTASETFRVTKLINIPMSVPVYIEPDEDDFSVMTIINNNESTPTWEFVENGGVNKDKTAVRYNYSYTADADDWCILPAINCDQAGLYEFSMMFGTKYSAESMEVVIADTPDVEAMAAATPIITITDECTSDEFVQKKGLFTTDAPKTVYVGLHATSPKGRSFLFAREMRVNKIDDLTPLAPQIGTISFDGFDGSIDVILPTKTMTGTDIAVSEVSAKVTVSGEEYPIYKYISGAPGATVNIPLILSKGQHTVSAYAYYSKADGTELTSPEVEQTFTVTRPSSFQYTLPFVTRFTEEDVSDLTIIDNNNDGKTWAYDASGLKYTYHSSNQADDWAITLPIYFPDASKTYNISVDTKTSSFAEAFDIFIGTTPEISAMTQCILDVPEFKSSNTVNKTNDFTVPAAGRYYVGIHAKSPADRYNLYIQSLTIAQATSDDSPGAVNNLTAMPDQTGALSATVEFDMPLKKRSEQQLDTQEELTATITTPAESKTVTGLPGAHISTTVAAINGVNNITVSVANAAGSSEISEVSARCGLDTPKAPKFTKVDVSEDGLGVLLEWEPVTEGINGGVVNPSAMMYRVSEYDEDDEDWYAVEHLAGTSYEYRVSAGTPLDFVKLCIEAYNSPSTNSSKTEVTALAGEPKTLAVEENFTNGQLDQPVTYILSTSTTAPSWSLDLPGNVFEAAALEGGQKVLVGHTTANSGDSGIVLPLFATTNAEFGVTFTIDAYMTENTTPTMAVYARTFGTDRQLVGNLVRESDGWATYSFTLPADLLNRPWVEIMIYNNFIHGSADYALIKSYSVKANPDTGVEETLLGGVNVFGTNGAILVTGAEGMNMTVADTTGKVIFSGKGTANMTIPAMAGVNIVNIDGKVYKVIVR